MRILAFDTSTKYLTIAVAEDSKVLTGHTQLANRDHASLIIKAVDKVLRRVKLSLCDIGCFALGIGPGSFTGLRIGVSAIKGFALATDRPVVAVSSYDAIAARVFVKRVPVAAAKEVAVIGDAKKEKIYAAVYKDSKGKLRNISGYLLLKPKEFVKTVRPPIAIAGDGIACLNGLLKSDKRSLFQFLPEPLWYPRAGTIAKLAFEKFKKGKTVNPDKLLPLYIYSNECDITGI